MSDPGKRYKGKVTAYSWEFGYGIIKLDPESGLGVDEVIFVPSSVKKNGLIRTLDLGTSVEFSVIEGRDGLMAVDISPA